MRRERVVERIEVLRLRAMLNRARLHSATASSVTAISESNATGIVIHALLRDPRADCRTSAAGTQRRVLNVTE